jgi:hypothetical protein
MLSDIPQEIFKEAEKKSENLATNLKGRFNLVTTFYVPNFTILEPEICYR